MNVWPVILIYRFCTYQSQTVSGPLRAAGKQAISAVVFWIAHFAVALPIAALAVFKFDAGLKGAWIGPLVSAIINTIALNCIFLNIEWPSLIAQAEQQREADRGVSDENADPAALDTSDTRESDNYISLNKTQDVV